jgi:FMN-dependent NADH-azoreductase
LKILHLDSSILGPQSVSRMLSADVVATLTEAHPHAEVTYRDLAADPLPHLSGAYIALTRFGAQDEPDEALARDLARGQAVLEEFLAADVVVIGVAFYNFTIATQLKAWIDRLAVPGKTFRYTEKGPEGLCGGKRVILAIARGGFYGPNSPAAAFEHAESYLRALFAFIGIPSPEVIVAEGLATSLEQRETALSAASRRIAALSA